MSSGTARSPVPRSTCWRTTTGGAGNLGKKREYLLRAGDQARTDYANLAAIDYYGRLSPLLDGAERVPVLLHLGTVLELTGEWVKAETDLPDALALAERIG